jgi:hypothetical protein
MNNYPEDRPSPTYTSAREAALDEQASMDEWDYDWNNEWDDEEGESK